MTAPCLSKEWLEPDGLGGFSSGTAAGVNTRRYHAVLLASLNPPDDRHVLVNDLAVWVESADGRRQVSQHHFEPGVTTEAHAELRHFNTQPWPTFTYEVDGATLTREILVCHGVPIVICRWTLVGLRSARLCVRPLLSGRGFHALQRENGCHAFEVRGEGPLREITTYPALPRILVLSDTEYRHDPQWWRQFSYIDERARGLDWVEDLAAPGVFSFDLDRGPAELIIALDTPEVRSRLQAQSARACATALIERERSRRAGFADRLERAADAYIVRRGASKTVIAGYPWFGDWGRDTFIAVRGLCLSGSRWETGLEILLHWATLVERGLLPNRFPDRAGQPLEYNSVDAALWYVVAAGDVLDQHGSTLSAVERERLLEAIAAIVDGYRRGTLHHIGVTADGLLAAGSPGLQLTWMDAKVGNWVVTPRVGKPVEVQALWLNALSILERHAGGCRQPLELGLRSFEARFENAATGWLNDVVDVDHEPGRTDPSLRPNQVLALGGLPLALLPPERCRPILEQIERVLWTPLGLRSLSPEHPSYGPRYEGDPRQRDAVYHQGTVWPWLFGPFVEAWVRARGATVEARQLARQRFLEPLRRHLDEAGLDHVSEIADAEAPHAPRGCPFQAWSVGELLRLERWLAPLREAHPMGG